MVRTGLKEGSLYVRTLESAQVDEDDYFAHTTFEDPRPIIRDIREAPRADTATADKRHMSRRGKPRTPFSIRHG